MDKEFMIYEDKLKTEESEELVDGIRIMITGEFQNLITRFMEEDIECTSYSQAIGQLVTTGITEIIEDLRKKI